VRPRRRAVAVVLLLVGLLTGCGVATQDHPEPVDRSVIPPVPTPTVAVLPDPGSPAVPPPPTTTPPVSPPVSPTR